MNNQMVAITVILGFVCVAGLFVYLAVLGGAGGRKKLESALLPIGFRLCSETEKEALAPKLLIVNPRHTGKRLLMHLYSRKSSDGSVQYVCDYRLSGASGRTTGTRQLLICQTSPELDLPRLTGVCIPDPDTLAGKVFKGLSQAFPLPASFAQVKTVDRAFDAKFDLRLKADRRSDPAALSPLLSAIATTIPTSKGMSLDTGKDVIVLSSLEMGADLVRNAVDSQKLLNVLHVSEKLFKAILQPKN